MTSTPTSDASATRPLALVPGASSGIGRAVADQVAQQGFDLVIAAEDDTIKTAPVELEQHGGSRPGGAGRPVHLRRVAGGPA